MIKLDQILNKVYLIVVTLMVSVQLVNSTSYCSCLFQTTPHHHHHHHRCTNDASCFQEQVTVGLLKEAMERSGKSKILIDGFPRNDSNREVFQKVVGYDCSLVLFFDCPEDVLEKRILSRNQGRVDDNIETIKKVSSSIGL